MRVISLFFYFLLQPFLIFTRKSGYPYSLQLFQPSFTFLFFQVGIRYSCSQLVDNSTTIQFKHKYYYSGINPVEFRSQKNVFFFLRNSSNSQISPSGYHNFLQCPPTFFFLVEWIDKQYLRKLWLKISLQCLFFKWKNDGFSNLFKMFSVFVTNRNYKS